MSSFSDQIVEALFSLGVREVVSCPGGRSADLLNSFVDHKGFQIESLYDERTAGFYALGRSIHSKAPVVVLTTSGSAVAGLYPAVLEAKHQAQAHLILLTADRPEEFRFTGAPQTINQLDFFSASGVTTVDVKQTSDVTVEGSVVHLNVSLNDPNPPAVSTEKGHYGDLLVFGSLSAEERSEVVNELGHYKGCVILEPLSNLKAADFPHAHVIRFPDLFFSKVNLASFAHIFRLGGVPVSKFWRHVEGDKVHFWDRHPFSGAFVAKPMSLDKIARSMTAASNLADDFADRLDVFESLVDETVLDFEHSEVSLLQKMSDQIPEQSKVFLGNSLPIREWVYCKPERFENIGQRGVNGIDGSLSYFLGQLDDKVENWIVLGDLTTLYNIGDFQILQKLKNFKVRIVVVNNSGGQIFRRIFNHNQKYFVNRQNRSFEKLADFWSLGYVKNTSHVQLPLKVLVELNPKNESSDQLWSEWKAIEF